ncbi:acyltransferase family protein [Brachybacterium sp.]|uniref:acyltransferase family protein n=1 Tax=Brachybacterium sp. TaxID=1891286 RepID=UPI002ED0516F
MPASRGRAHRPTDPSDGESPWIQDPLEQSPRPRSRLDDWLSGPLPSRTTSLEDWLQGPVEEHAEQEAEDAWSTGDSVSGASGGEDRSPAEHSGRDRFVRDRFGREHPESGAAGERPADAPAPRPRPAFRAELHGLRAIALGLVAVYHVWLGRVSGGVDVFLFLSAFFLTGTFLRRLESGRPLGIPRYWLHTFKRLLPPAAVTILLTLLATGLLLPPSSWPAIMKQAVASAVYLENAALVLMQVDYQQQDASASSPLQHFWSLSVQGQAFLLWPLLFALALPVARRGRAVRRPLLVLMLLIAGASLTWSVLSTATQQPIAYFDTAARLWEFAAGSMLAVVLPALDRLTGAARPESGAPPRFRVLRTLLGWAGIAGLLAIGVLLDVSSLFPGWVAVLPLAAAGAVVVAGYSGTRWGVDRLLSTRPAAFFGDISYALYLVHWPILVMWLHVSDQGRAGLWDGLVVLSASALLAWLLTRLVDAPIRRSAWLEARPWRALTAVAVSLALVVGTAAGWSVFLQRSTTEEPAATASPALPTDEVATEASTEILPHGWERDSQWPKLPYQCAGSFEPASTFPHVPCEQFLPEGASYDGVLVVLGSSHARQWIPSLLPWAQEHGLQVVNLHMDGCDFVPGIERGSYCSGYDEYALTYIDTVQPDVVLTTSTRTEPDSAEETTHEGMVNAVAELTGRGIDVISVRDNPRWERDQFTCAEEVITDDGTPADADAACGADASEKLAPESPAAGLTPVEGGGSLTLVDLSDRICPGGRCSPVLGDTYVYLDDDHLTRRFVEQALVDPMTEILEGPTGPRSVREAAAG